MQSLAVTTWSKLRRTTLILALAGDGARRIPPGARVRSRCPALVARGAAQATSETTRLQSSRHAAMLSSMKQRRLLALPLALGLAACAGDPVDPAPAELFFPTKPNGDGS